MTRRANALLGLAGGALITAGSAILADAGATSPGDLAAILAVALGGVALGARP